MGNCTSAAQPPKAAPIPAYRIIGLMRVIVGKYRGRRLVAGHGDATRPILDRVKQALFDRLGSRWGRPGELPDMSVLDLFAGVGNLGIEALSRGASYCCFVEQDRAALQALRANLCSIGIAGEAIVVTGDAASTPIPAPPHGGYRLIFLDPPYPLSREASDASPLAAVFRRLGRDIAVAHDALIVWRLPLDAALPPTLPGHWRVEQRHDYGSMRLALLVRTAP